MVLQQSVALLRRAAEAVLALLMGLMFAAFIAQVIFRYGLNLPLGWTEEVCNLVWLWGILWGAALVLRNHEDIRFDMLYNLLPRTLQRALTVFSSSAIVLLLLGSLPATWAYISFMKVEKSPALQIPMHWVFSVYLLFVLAMCVRHSYIAWSAINNRLVEDQHRLIDPAVLRPENSNQPAGSGA